MLYAVGAYGTHNLGDDAILEGIRIREGSDVVAVADSPLRNQRYLLWSEVMSTSWRFASTDRLIVGGGGIFHSETHIHNMRELAAKFQEAGGFEIRAVGLENLAEPALGNNNAVLADLEWLITNARRVTTRTTWSLTWLSENSGIQAEYEPDFAVELANELEGLPLLRTGCPQVGLVLTGTTLGDELFDVARRLTDLVPPEWRILIMPHARQLHNPANDDVLSGEILRAILVDRGRDVAVAPWCLSPRQILWFYRSSDLILTQRLHGAYFAQIVGVPCAVWGVNLKLTSYLADYGSQLVQVAGPDRMPAILEAAESLRVERHRLNWPTAEDLEWGYVSEVLVPTPSNEFLAHPVLFSSGWHGPEGSGDSRMRWTNGREASLVVNAYTSKSLTLRLQLRMFHEDAPDRRLDVWVGEQHVGHISDDRPILDIAITASPQKVRLLGPAPQRATVADDDRSMGVALTARLL